MTDATTKPARYQRKPFFVDAMNVTATNFLAIAQWSKGIVHNKDGSAVEPGQDPNEQYIKINVDRPQNPRETRAYIGDWVVRTERGFKIYRRSQFLKFFVPVVDEAQPALVSPPAEEDHTPTETWIAKDQQQEFVPADDTERVDADAVGPVPGAMVHEAQPVEEVAP